MLIKHTEEYDMLQEDMWHQEKIIHATTQLIMKYNDADYTAWYLRRQHIKKIKDKVEYEGALWGEWQFVLEACVQFPKNYQVWFQRQWIVDAAFWHGDMFLQKEIADLNACIQGQDQKNYHAWQYLQWLLTRFPQLITQSGLDYTERLLREDRWNNSAWNHRAFVINLMQSQGSEPDWGKERALVKELTSESTTHNAAAAAYSAHFIPPQ